MIDHVAEGHLATILANNLQYVHWLSPLDPPELRALVNAAPYAKQIDHGMGVLLGFTSECDYESDNLTWLRASFQNFIYIDRVIIGEKGHRKGYGRALYEDFSAFGRAQGRTRMVCEVNTIPDNPVSHKFHLDLGFNPCGEMDMLGGAKRVRYYEKTL